MRMERIVSKYSYAFRRLRGEKASLDIITNNFQHLSIIVVVVIIIHMMIMMTIIITERCG
jgi:hypothetical protein